MNLNVFPDDILKYLASHAINPKASTDSDLNLSLALNNYNSDNFKYVLNVKKGSVFKAFNGKKYRLIRKLRKRYECLDVLNNKLYLFSPNARILENHD